MPLYEYRCADCGNEFECLRSLSQMDSAVACPACRSARTQRKVSTFIAKGWTRGKVVGGRLPPEEYELVPTDHSDEEDWADF
jgi:putative FmdB family regulatory protein